MKKVAVLDVRYPAFDPELDNAPERPSADPPSTPEPASARGGGLSPATNSASHPVPRFGTWAGSSERCGMPNACLFWARRSWPTDAPSAEPPDGVGAA